MTSNSVVEKVRRALHAAILDMERDAGGEGCAFEELTEQQITELDILAQAALAAMDDGWRDRVRRAYLAGATDVHIYWKHGGSDTEPDFAEAAIDYADQFSPPPPEIER